MEGLQAKDCQRPQEAGAGQGEGKKNWFKGLKAEFKKIIWPDKKTLIKETVAVTVFSIVLGAIICVFSFYPTASTLATHKKNYEETLTAMNLDKGDLTLDFTIKEKKIELRAIQAGEEEVATMLIRNFSQVKVNKDGVGLYINENMYYIENDEIVLGSKEELLKIFKNAKVTIKNRR